jgi:hypothetical protein
VALFRRKRRTRTLVVHLKARLMPMDRGEIFEDPLDAHLSAAGVPASVSGAGTLVSDEGEPLSCDLELDVPLDEDAAVVAARVAELLDSLGAPRGSTVLDEDGTTLATFGVAEGLALYLNGTDLPEEVYATSDTRELADAVGTALGDSGRMLSYWHGPTETALYLYGPSAEVMRSRLTDLLTSRPDTQLSRLETID